MVNYTVSNVQANHTINAEFNKMVNVGFERDSSTRITRATYGLDGGAQTEVVFGGAGITVPQGSSIDVTVFFGTGAEFDRYEIEDQETAEIIETETVEPFTYVLGPEDITIKLYSKSSAVTYTITASAGTGGTIDPSGQVTVQAGANQTFAVTPNTGYQIKRVTLDGTPIQPDD